MLLHRPINHERPATNTQTNWISRSTRDITFVDDALTRSLHSPPLTFIDPHSESVILIARPSTLPVIPDVTTARLRPLVVGVILVLLCGGDRDFWISVWFGGFVDSSTLVTG